MKLRNLFYCILIFLLSFSASAQNQGFETGKFFDTEDKLWLHVVHLNMQQEVSVKQNSPGSNEVFISQVGFGNKISSRISSSDAFVNMEQYGRNNEIDIDLQGKKIHGLVVQNGQNNEYRNDVNDPTAEITFSVVQNGNNNNFQKIGSNSIGNKLQFNITGDSKTILVRNFK